MALNAHRLSSSGTIVDLLLERAGNGEGGGFEFLADGESVTEALSWAALADQMCAVSAGVLARCRPRDRALLFFRPGLDFLVTFLGCLHAGVIPVPCVPPTRPFRRAFDRIDEIVRVTSPSIVISGEKALPSDAGGVATITASVSQARIVGQNELLTEEREPRSRAAVDEVAFLQFTSGSTSAPKGVMVTHANLMTNLQDIQESVGDDRHSVTVTWMPIYHDFGLIDGVLGAIFSGHRCVCMPPHAFVQKPIRWLRAISRYKATHSGSPNFGYELCVAKISSDEASRLDLSSWRIAANGSEPIRPATLHAFQERFASSGFRPSAFHPCYGLAEATLKVTIGTADRLRDRFLDADALERGQVLEVSAEAPRARAIASSGSPSRHVELAIVDPESCEELSEGQIGEIWVAGRSVTAGYYNNEKASAETFSGRLVTSNRGPFLRTGDLGFTKEGELYVTGRRKDLIILAGRNLYPQDIERTVEDAHELLGTGCAVAFAVDDGRQEQLVVLFELARPRSDSGWTPLNVIDTVFRAIRRDHLVDASAIAAVPRGALLRTTSGKIRRRACRQAWSSGGLDLLERVPAGGASS